MNSAAATPTRRALGNIAQGAALFRAEVQLSAQTSQEGAI